MNKPAIVISISALILTLTLTLSACSSSSDENIQNAKEEAMETGRSSGAKVNLRNAITAAKYIQTRADSTDFSSVTFEALKMEDQDISWTQSPLDSSSDPSAIAVIDITNDLIVFQSRIDGETTSNCLFVELNSESNTRYGTAIVNSNEACPESPNSENGSDYVDSQSGWLS